MANSMFLKLFNSKTFKNQDLVDSEADSDASLASDGPIMCYDSLTLHGYCFSCNIIPPTEMFKNNTVHHHFKLAYSLDPNSTLSHQEEKLQGFPFIAMTSKERGRIYSYPALNKSPINTFTHKTCDPPDSKDKNKVCNMPDEYKSRHREFGFYSIHNPYDVPSPFMRWYYDKKFMNHELQVLVDATSYLLIDKESFQRPPDERECFSSTSEKERQLKFFKYYTRRNCLVECFTDKILENCSCVLYFLPHTEGTPICGNAESKACAHVIMEDVNIESSWKDCNCLASCNHTEYRAISREIIPQPNSTTQYTMVLRDDTLYPKIRRQTEILEELVQSSMTYLDMFLGVSLISLVEIVYYILLMCMECLGINRTIRRSMKRFERKVFTVDAQCPKVDDKKESLDECSRVSFEKNTLKKRVGLFAKNEFC
ncbi:pickpocket protein 28-like [Nilaparvata lugens]|uniref:pickpocket protein 28-like n=1 Tax=Nilaparvata lugens TaxID=108931 RepID=UPI00193CF0E7|nr:pickpocket protein 28-like [Nilaparvata lugens]